MILFTDDVTEKEVTVGLDGISSHIVFVDHPYGEISVHTLRHLGYEN
jgi:hypothetical protein